MKEDCSQREDLLSLTRTRIQSWTLERGLSHTGAETRIATTTGTSITQRTSYSTDTVFGCLGKTRTFTAHMAARTLDQDPGQYTERESGEEGPEKQRLVRLGLRF